MKLVRFRPSFFATLLVTPLVAGAAISACSSDPTPVTNADSGLVEDSGVAVDTGITIDPDSSVPVPEASADSARDVISTGLELDVTTLKGKATIRVAASTKPGLSFEIGDLVIESVKLGAVALKYTVVDLNAGTDAGAGVNQRLDIGVPVATTPSDVVITYTFKAHKAFDGWDPSSNVSFLWPYFCSNLFPCHSNPDDGSTFTLNVTGVPAGLTAVYPKSIPFDAPTYMPAIAIGNFTYKEVGTTTAGTHVGYYTLPAQADAGVAVATAKMADIFNWYETTLGAYKFGDHVGSVDANWGPGAYGGMEHHPFWHVATDAFNDEEVHAHEAAHGWFGDGVRIKCWEDFVLSEGTVSYLAARAIEVVRGKTEGDKIWASYSTQLTKAIAAGDTEAWPQTCNKIDILTDPLWSNIPYMKGAYFYKKVATAITPAKLDQILAKFYTTYAGKPASMGDMIALIKSESGFDPATLVNAWLKGKGNPGT